MKKFLLLLFVSTFVKSLNAQSWCVQGAKWHYTAFSTLSGHDLIVEYSYTGDTTVQGKTCNIIKGVFSGTSMLNQFYTDTTVQNYRKYITRQENDVLYNYTAGMFDTIVDFNASVGDTWLYRLACSPKQTFTVTGIGTISYHSVNYRMITASFTYSYMSNGSTLVVDTTQMDFTEKLIYAGNWEDIFPRRCPLNPEIPYDGPFEYFCGYEDANVPLQMANLYGCGRFVGIGETKKQETHLNLFPNPATEKITVELAEATSVKVFSSQGNLVYSAFSGAFGEHEIDISGLAPGIYFVRTESRSANRVGKFIRN